LLDVIFDSFPILNNVEDGSHFIVSEKEIFNKAGVLGLEEV